MGGSRSIDDPDPALVEFIMPWLSADQESTISMPARARRAAIFKALGRREVAVLEIGAADTPTYRKSEDAVYYADFCTAEELKRRFARAPNRSPARVVDVDYVLRNRDLPTATGRKFDLVIANHVIEHVPDVVGWLKQVAAIVPSPGYLFLSVPDRRYTFDYFRSETDAVEMVRAHEEGLAMPSQYQIARALYYTVNVDRKAIWAGNAPPRPAARMSFSEALTRSKALAQTYNDVHCWIFTQDGFRRAVDDLSGAGLIDWKLTDFEPVARDQNEFHVMLRR